VTGLLGVVVSPFRPTSRIKGRGPHHHFDVGAANMGVGRGACRSWNFMHDADKVEGGLIVLLFVLFFPSPPPGNFSADALVREKFKIAIRET